MTQVEGMVTGIFGLFESVFALSETEWVRASTAECFNLQSQAAFCFEACKLEVIWRCSLQVLVCMNFVVVHELESAERIIGSMNFAAGVQCHSSRCIGRAVYDGTGD
jgi:hypothetical protein